MPKAQARGRSLAKARDKNFRSPALEAREGRCKKSGARQRVCRLIRQQTTVGDAPGPATARELGRKSSGNRGGRTGRTAEPGMHTCREPCCGRLRCGKGKEQDITPNDRGMGNHAAVVFCVEK